MSIQELKETWLRRIKTIDEEIGKTDSDTEREKMVRLVAKRSVYQYELSSLQSLQSEHKGEMQIACEWAQNAWCEGDSDIPKFDGFEDYYQKTFKK